MRQPRLVGALTVASVLLLGGVLGLTGFAAADLWFGGGDLVFAALGRDAVVSSCSSSLTARLVQKGFEPADLDLQPQPHLENPWGQVRTVKGHFTFVDGPGQTRVDGVMACLVSRAGVTVEFEVAATPHRDA